MNLNIQPNICTHSHIDVYAPAPHSIAAPILHSITEPDVQLPVQLPSSNNDLHTQATHSQCISVAIDELRTGLNIGRTIFFQERLCVLDNYIRQLPESLRIRHIRTTRALSQHLHLLRLAKSLGISTNDQMWPKPELKAAVAEILIKYPS